MTNAPSGEEHRGKTDTTARIILEGDLQETLNTQLLYQHLDYDRRGKPREMHCIDPRRVAANPVFAGEDCAVNARNNSRTVIPAGGSGALLRGSRIAGAKRASWTAKCARVFS